MNYRLIHPGRGFHGPLDEAARIYMERLCRQHKVDERLVRPERVRKEGPSAVKTAIMREGKRILDAVEPNDLLVTLDKGGKAMTSEALAQKLSRWQGDGHRVIVFALGGPFGLCPTVLKRANTSLSFGPMTLPHDLARVLFWEQLYRAGTITRGEPYHK